MPLLSHIAAHPFLAALACFAIYWTSRLSRLLYVLWRQSRSPLRKLPGPRGVSSWILGHTGALVEGPAMQALEAWQRKYGENFVIRGAFGKQILITTDLWALTHILSAGDSFGKTEAELGGLETFLGTNGVIWVQGEQHAKQRRIMNPAFGHAAVCGVTPILLEGSLKLCELWNNACIAGGGTARIEVIEWFSRVTQSIIARAAFDYDARTMNEDGETSSMAAAVTALFRTDVKPVGYLRNVVNNYFPLLRVVFFNRMSRLAAECRVSLHEAGKEIFQDRKAAVVADGGSPDKALSDRKDLMSLLLRANLAHDLDPSVRLSDAEVIAQIPTFIISGYESTSNTVAWAMHSLSTLPDIQAKLRAEVQEVPTETPTLDMLNSLPYLDCVVRETLRLYDFVTYLVREAFKEDHILLEEPTRGRDGQTLSRIHIHPGDEVIIPVWLVNRNQRIWGPDANEFRPERWQKMPDKASGIPGITPGHLTFGGGPRACVGHRFAVAEMKVLLFHIVRGFQFSPTVEPSEIWARAGQLLHPQLRSDDRVQLPMILTPVG